MTTTVEHDPPVTVRTIRQAKGHRPVVAATAYDFTFARLFDEAGVDVILVGDSLGMVVQGHSTTLPVTVEDIIYHCRAVARGIRRAHLVADMPFMSYQVTDDEAVRNAGRIVAEGGAHAVKLEGGRPRAAIVRRLVDAGIPVMGHLGLTPQSVHAMGGFVVQGREAAQAQRLLEDGHALVDAGAYAIVLEGIPGRLAGELRDALPIPTIGIGAGVDCDGQVLVGYDLLGLTAGPRPRFVKTYEAFLERGIAAARSYCDEVRARAFPTAQHTYGSA